MAFAFRLEGDIIGISPYSSDKQISLSISHIITPYKSSILLYFSDTIHPPRSSSHSSHLLDNVRQGARHPYPTQQIDTSSTKGTHVASTIPLLGSPWPPIPGRHYYLPNIKSQWDYSLAVWNRYRSPVKQVDGHQMQVDGEKGRKAMKTIRVS